jgi:type II secretory pathway pseudopilin PulG
MIELIFGIVVLGILAALTIPRLDRDIRQEAGINILSSIRYTQHLAMVDDKTDPTDPNWQQTLWMIRFSIDNNGRDSFYTVSTDINQDGSIAKSETAVDPANGKYMFNTAGATVNIDDDESPNIFIGRKYGINRLITTGGCTGIQHIAFDHMGRPHVGLKTTPAVAAAGNNYATLMTSDCNLTFSFVGGQDDLTISIIKETGYAFIVGQGSS